MPAHNRFLEGSFAPVTEEITAFDLPVTGRLPAELSGRYLRNGPNPLGRDDPTTVSNSRRVPEFAGDCLPTRSCLDQGL
jgi:carotenoid cleavage dioxygenase-like enzyme